MYRLSELELLKLHPILVEIAEAVSDHFDLWTITSAFRPGDDGVHGHFRGLDIRCRDKDLGAVVEEWVNARWRYDHLRPEKKCCICHDTGRGLHLHLQVHPNTVRVLTTTG